MFCVFILYWSHRRMPFTPCGHESISVSRIIKECLGSMIWRLPKEIVQFLTLMNRWNPFFRSRWRHTISRSRAANTIWIHSSSRVESQGKTHKLSFSLCIFFRYSSCRLSFSANIYDFITQCVGFFSIFNIFHKQKCQN